MMIRDKYYLFYTSILFYANWINLCIPSVLGVSFPRKSSSRHSAKTGRVPIILYPLAANHAQAEGVHLQMVKVNMNRKFAFGSDETYRYIARVTEELWESGA